MSHTFSPALASRIAHNRLRASASEAMRRGDFYAARQLQKRQETWRAAENETVKPTVPIQAITPPPILVEPVEDDDAWLFPPWPLEEHRYARKKPPSDMTEGERAVDDFMAIYSSELRRIRDREAMDERYRRAWIRAGCPGTLHEFAEWKSSGKDSKYEFEEWLEIKERARAETSLHHAGIHHPTPIYELLRGLMKTIREHGLMGVFQETLREVRAEDRRERDEAIKAHLAERTPKRSDPDRDRGGFEYER